MASSPSKTPCGPFPGQVALVTGAGIRLGRAIAKSLAENGCELILHYRSSRSEAQSLAAEIKKLGRKAVLIKADLSKGKETENLAKQAEKALGRVDILVNSAAVFWPTLPERLNEKELNAFLDINLKSPYILSSEIGQRMKARGGGAIINMACVSGLRPWKSHVPYSISKAGIIALTVGMAKVLGPEVRVNAIAPGTVLPPENMPAGQLESIRERLPLKKLGTPEDITSAVLYLLGARFVTGQVLCVDGGRSIV
ncbi:MAG TPA: SDR family oxidoreductase [Planctomycetota bacterium]|nr:SDR family oxidoreductase [Planctomycetota bacterium]